MESYQGKQTAMSNIVSTDPNEPEEPMWAITEDSLSILPDFEFKIGANHPLMNNNEGGTIEYDDDKLIVTGKAYFNETSFFTELNDAYIYFFLTVKNPNVKIRFKNLVNPSDDKEIILDYKKLGIKNNVGKINIMVVLCRAHAKNIEATNKTYVGKNYLYTSINYWDSNKTIKDGYLSNIQNDNTLHTGEYLFSEDNVLEGISKYKTSVVLLHDGPNKSTTVEALGSLIEELKSQGAEILPIDEDTKTIQYIKAESVK
jgi:hypothetical protein